MTTREKQHRQPRIELYDEGCELAPRCLTCPLVLCKYDDPRWPRNTQRIGRDEVILEAIQKERLLSEEAAHRFHISIRTVYRIKRRNSPEQVDTPRPQPVVSMRPVETQRLV